MDAGLATELAPPPRPRSLAQVAASFDTSSVLTVLRDDGRPARSDDSVGTSARRWALLYGDGTIEAWAIAWPAGSGLGLHDHDGSSAGVHVVAGQLRERYVAAADGELLVRWWDQGAGFELPSDHVHEVVNVGVDEAVSVHVYSPPLGDIRFRDER